VTRFKTDESLIDLLVGQSLYSDPDVAMRELLQNAEDACHLQRIEDASHEPKIAVRYSIAGRWIEISDNGIGMDESTFESSFATVGASKNNSPRLQALLAKAGASDRPIGQFGIGVLSCFGIANAVEVRTLAKGWPPVSYRINDRRQEFSLITNHRETPGTTLRLELKPDGPMRPEQVPESVERYARHARHITLENVDLGQASGIKEQWLLPTWESGASVASPAIEEGYIQLSDAWESISIAIDSQLILCNGGFLVTRKASQALPEYAIGLQGEVNVKPGALTILMNREGFQQDERWRLFAADITSHYQRLVASKLDAWKSLDYTTVLENKARAIQRMVLLILRSPMKEAVGEENERRARELLPMVLLLAGPQRTDFQALMLRAQERPPMYLHRTDDQQQVQRSFSDRGQSVSVTESVGSVDLRVSLLRLNGFAVARVERHDYTVQVQNANKTHKIHDADVLAELCSLQGIETRRVQDAPSDHTRIGASVDAEAITRLLEMSSELKIQSVDTMTQAIIADFNGYILNVDNVEIQRVLQVIPDAVGNPIRKDLLAAYLALSTYDVSRARTIIFGLLTDTEFEKKVHRKTGRHFRDYLERRVQALLRKGV
jgi:hypothetical protein